LPLKLKKRHGGTNWYLVGTVAGKHVDRSTKTHDAKIANQLRAKVEEELHREAIFGEKAVASFAYAVTLYVKTGRSKRFLNKLVKYFGNTLLCKIDQRALDRAAESLYPNCSGSTLNRQVFAPMSAVLTFAAKRNLCERIVVSRRTESKGVVRWLKPEEAERLLLAASPHLRIILLFLFHTGARVGEALKLDWKHVDLSQGTITFEGTITKNGITRTVPISKALRNALATLPYRMGTVLRTDDGRPYAEKENAGGQIKTAFRTACRKAGIENFRPHDTRHTWATWHFHANRDLIMLKELGGWRDERMVLRYAHADVAKFAGSMEKLPEIWAAK
jgi:integrase